LQQTAATTPFHCGPVCCCGQKSTKTTLKNRNLPTHTEKTQWIPALQKANKDELDNANNLSGWLDFTCTAMELRKISLWSLDEHILNKLGILDKLWMNSITHARLEEETQKQTDWVKHLIIEFKKEIYRDTRDNKKRDYNTPPFKSSKG